MLIYRDAFIHGCFNTEMLFTKTCFYTQTLTHTQMLLFGDAFTRSYTGAFTQGCFYTKELLHADTRVLLHTDAFTHQCVYTELLHMCFYTGSHSRQSTLYTEKLVHKYSYADFFTRKCIYTEAVLKHRQSTDTVTKRRFARISLHRDAFTHRRF